MLFKLKNIFNLNRYAFLLSLIFFMVMPFAWHIAAGDPELFLRYFILSAFLTTLSGYFLMRWKQEDINTFLNPGLCFQFFLLFFLVCAVSVLKSINTGDSLYELSKIFLLLLALLFLIYALKKEKKAINLFVLFINIAVILFCTKAFMQSIPVIKTVIYNHGTFEPGKFLTSWFANKNQFAEALFLSLPFAIYGSCYLEKTSRVISVTSLLLILPTILILASLAVWIATLLFFVLTLLFLILFYRKQNKTKILYNRWKLKAGLLVTVLSLFIILLLTTSILQDSWKPLLIKYKAFSYYFNTNDEVFRNKAENSNSLYERMLMIRNSVKMIKENPILGCGLGNWKILFPKYGITGTGFISYGILRFEHPHNDYLFVFCETGLLGLVLWLCLLISSLYSCYLVIKKTTDKQTVFLFILLFSGIAGFMMISLFSYPKERLYSMLLLLVMIAIPSYINEGNRKIKFSYGKSLFSIVIIFCLFSSYLQAEHLRGEILMKEARYYQKKKNFLQMGKKVLKAKSFFYPLDITGTPLNWYLGFTRYYSGDTLGAFTNFKKAVEENPYHLQVLNDLGTLYEKQGAFEKAIELYDRALLVSPYNFSSQINRTVAYYNQGNLKEAFTSIKSFPDTTRMDYKNVVNALLIAAANKYVQEKKDSGLANYLSEQLMADKNFLLRIYETTPGKNISFDDLAEKQIK